MTYSLIKIFVAAIFCTVQKKIYVDKTVKISMISSVAGVLSKMLQISDRTEP